MMNDETEPFERRLQNQSLKKIPAGWRVEILAAARDAQSACHSSLVTHHSLLSTIRHQLSTVFWPNQKAWGALAAVWIFIFALNFSLRDTTPRAAEKSAPPSPEVLVELKRQQLLFAELVGSAQSADADRQKLFAPKPRSEHGEILMT